MQEATSIVIQSIASAGDDSMNTKLILERSKMDGDDHFVNAASVCFQYFGFFI